MISVLPPALHALEKAGPYPVTISRRLNGGRDGASESRPSALICANKSCGEPV